MVFNYDAGKFGTVWTLLKFQGTMLPMVLTKPIFYFLMVTHVIFLIVGNVPALWKPEYQHVACPNTNVVRCSYLPTLEWTPVTVVTTLLTFFIVFYGNQCYGRMQMFYGHCVGLGGTCMNWACLVRNHFPDEPNVQWNAARLMLASMHIMYYTMNTSEDGPSMSESEWNTVRSRHLLNDAEISSLVAFGGYKPFLPLVWALAEVEDALLAPVTNHRSTLSGTGPPDANMERFRVSDLLSDFRELSFAFRGHCGAITSWMNNPVPFPYFHGLTLLVLFDLLLISYTLVDLGFDPYFTALTFFFICLVFLGLREVAVAMSDPFGDDVTDFDLEKMLSGAYKNTVAILQDKRQSQGSRLVDLLNPITNQGARFTVANDSKLGSVRGTTPGGSQEMRELSRVELLAAGHTSSDRV